MTLSDIARRHGFSEGAVDALAQAMRWSGGSMAQFNHPELGGMGQWSRGGMLMIGDMFNNALKSRVDALANDVSAWLRDNPAPAPAPAAQGSFGGGGNWWPDGLGSPASSGAQNGMRYAYFPTTRRIAIEHNGRLSVYDSGDHQIGGVSQQQSGYQTLAFTSQYGTVRLEELPHLESSHLSGG